MADEAVKKVAKGADNSKMWIGGLVLIIVILLGVNFVYRGKIREAKNLEDAVAAKKGDSGMGGMMMGELGDKPVATKGAVV